jgi:hypothetical protein
MMHFLNKIQARPYINSSKEGTGILKTYRNDAGQ